MKSADQRLCDEPAILVEFVIDAGSRTEVRPDRNHQMEMLIVQLVDHPLRIGILWVPFHLAHGHPPEPVLHDVVHWDMKRAIFRRDAFNLRLRLILVLALPEAVGPAPEQRHFASQFAIVADNLVASGP